MFVTTFPVGPLQCNCSIIACEDTKQAVIVDPGGDTEKIHSFIKEKGFEVKYLLHTHAHFDHILSSGELKKLTGAKICLHKEDQFLYDNLERQCSLFGFSASPPVPIDHYLSDEEIVDIGKVKANVVHTPGHTPGSLCFNIAGQESLLLSGDTLFNASIGRTDLWGGSFDEIIKSINSRLMVLDDSTKVVPGHGEETTIWQEKHHNPFLR